MGKKIKVKLKAGVGKFIRLTTPTRSLIITDKDTEVDEETYNVFQQYLEKVRYTPEKKKEEAVEETSEKKFFGVFKE